MTIQQNAMPDFTEIMDHDIPKICGDDASLWATAFCQIAKKLGHDIDEGWMIGWFANAIEGSWDKRCRRAEPSTRPIAPDNCIHGASLTMSCPICEGRANGAICQG